MANTTTTINVSWQSGQSVILKGTPVDSSGNASNDGNAYGIVSESLFIPNKTLTVIIAGEWDEDYGYSVSGIALSDAAKLAMSNITFNNPPVVYVKKDDLASLTSAGVVKMAEAVEDSEETNSPTTAEFNGLLAKLRASGVIETPDSGENDPEPNE